MTLSSGRAIREGHADADGETPRATVTGAQTGQVLSFADGLPSARSEKDRRLRLELESDDCERSTRAALELGSAYCAIAPKAARGLLLRAACGPPLTAARALMRLVRLGVDAGEETRDGLVGEYLDRAQELTAVSVEEPESGDPELLALRIDLAAALALTGSLDTALRILLGVESALRRRDDHYGLGAPQEEPFRRLAALTSLRLGETQMESNPHAADGHLERAVMLGTGSLQATAALRRGTLLEHHAGGLGPEIERQYMLAIDLEDPYASPLALLAMGDILWESRRREKAREFWKQATVLGDSAVRVRAARRASGSWQREKHASARGEIDERLDYARPLQDVTPWTELGRIASGRAPDAPVDDDGPGRPVLVVGAGTGGHYLLPALAHGYDVVGFIDDDPGISSVGDIRVLGSTSQLGRILRENSQVAQVIFAIPTAPGTTRLRVLRAAHRHGVDVVALPPMFEIRHGHSLLAQLRPFEVHETYGDVPWHVDRAVQHQVRGRRVAIIGAGSVLGAEVARRVAHGQPRHLLLIDGPSVALMGVAGEIRKLRGLMDCEARIADYASEMELKEALSTPPAPEVILYCGGALHAPSNVLRPAHAARANVRAAATVAEVARLAGCTQLVMASSDRAGHRASMFDMTKALAEVAALRQARVGSAEIPTMRERRQSVGPSDGFRVSILRLPNLWARDGAVVGRLSEQLRHGGPLEVRSDRKRCFAPAWDAAQTMLRLLGGDHASGLFALASGEIVEIRELAERLLLVHGLVASRDIRIVSTSRPDTKASLKLFGSHESLGRESVTGALQIRQGDELKRQLKASLKSLQAALDEGDVRGVEHSLKPIDSVETEDDGTVLAV